MMNAIVSGQVKVVDKVFAYSLVGGGIYRLTGHGVEMKAMHAGNGVFRLHMVKGTLRNHGMRTLKVNDAGQLVTVS